MHSRAQITNKSKNGKSGLIGASPPLGSKSFRSPRSNKSISSKTSPPKMKERSRRGKSSTSGMTSTMTISNETSTLLMEGRLCKVGRTLIYTIREFSGSYFSLSLCVQETLQKWTVYVPITQDMTELLHMWDLAPRYRNKKLIGGWILSCTNLEFVNDVIIGASFDNNKLQKIVLSELMHFVNAQAVKVQSIVRGYTARSAVRLRKTEKREVPLLSERLYKGNTEDLVFYDPALEDNSLMSYRSSESSLKMGASGTKVRRAHGKKRSTKKAQSNRHLKANQLHQNDRQGHYYPHSEDENDDKTMTMSNLESSGMLTELLDVRSEISQALDMFRAEMNTLRAGLTQHLQVQDPPGAVQLDNPHKSEFNAISTDLSSPRDEVAILREEMKTVLNEVKELHQHMDKLRNEDIATMHKELKDSVKDVTPSSKLKPDNNDLVRIGSYSTTIDIRPLTGTEARPKSRVHTTNMADLQRIGPITMYKTPQVLQKVNSVEIDADCRPHTEILKDIENAALDPSIDAKRRQEELEELVGIADEQNGGQSAVRMQFIKEFETFGISTTQLQEIMHDVSDTYSPIVLRKAVVRALVRNEVQLAEKAAERLLFIISRIISSGTSYHHVVDTVLPRFDSAVASLQQFSSNRPIVKTYIDIMALVIGFADTDFVVEEYGSAGMCNVLLNLVDNNIDDEDLVVQIILLCCRLTASSISNRHRMGTIQNCKIVANLVTRYQNTKYMLTNITRLLCNICTQAPVNVDHMGEVGMCEKILECVELHCHDSKVLNIIARATLQLCYNNHSCNQRRFASAGGFDIFFHCLEAVASGTGAMFKLISMMVLGVCGTDGSILDELPVRSIVSLTKKVFALNSGITDAIVKATITLLFNFCANVSIQTALNEAGTQDLLTRLQGERSDSDVHSMIGMCVQRLCSVIATTESVTSRSANNALANAQHAREQSKTLHTVTEKIKSTTALPMGSYRRPHILLSQKSGDLDTNHLRSVEVLRNIDRAAADPTIEKRLRERDAKEILEQKAIDAGENLRRFEKKVDERGRDAASGAQLIELNSLVSNTTDPVLLRKALISAVTMANEALTEKTLQTLLKTMGTRVGTMAMAIYVDEFETFEDISSAWKRFPSNLTVIKCCIEIMSLMFVSVVSADILAEYAGKAALCDFIIDSIALGVDDHDLAMQAILLGCRLTITSQRNRYRMGSCRNCEIICHLFMLYINVKPVLTKLCRMCGNMAVNAPTVLDNMGEAGICDKVLHCMYYNRFDRHSLNLLAKLILLLCDNSHSNIHLFNSSRGFEVCISCLDTSRLLDAETFRLICTIIMALFGTIPSSLDLLPAAQTAEAFKSIIDDDQLDELSLKVLLSVLYNFTASAPLRSSLNKIGVPKLLSRISSTRTEQDIVTSSRIVLQRLTGLNAVDSTGTFSVPLEASSEHSHTTPFASSASANVESKVILNRTQHNPQSVDVVIESRSRGSISRAPTIDQSPPVISGKKYKLSKSDRQVTKSSSSVDVDKNPKSAELLRNIERAAADPNIDQLLREKEAIYVEALRGRDATEKLRRSTKLHIYGQRLDTIAGTPMQAIAFDQTIGVTEDPTTLRESLIAALLLNNQDIVEKSLRKICTMLKSTGSNTAVMQKAEVLFSTFDTLMNSLRQFPQNRDTVMHSIGCVSMILEASNNSDHWIEETGRSGLCDYLIDVCRMDEEVCDLSLKLCITLTSISVDNKHRIGTRHNCDVIGDLYLQYKRNALVVLRMTHFLHSMSTESPAILDNLGLGGVCEKIVECMDANSSNKEIISELSRTILLLCYNNHIGNRQRFATTRSADVFIQCLVAAMVPGGGDMFKQLGMMMMGVFGTVPDSLHLLPPHVIGEIAKTVILRKIELDDAHLKVTLTLIFSFGLNEDIKAALLAVGIQDALMEMQTASHKGGVPRLALLAFRRITTLGTGSSMRSGNAQRASSDDATSTQGRGHTVSESVPESLPPVGVEANALVTKAGSAESASPHTLKLLVSDSAPSSYTLANRTSSMSERNEPIPEMTATLSTEEPALQSPQRPENFSASTNSPSRRVPRKVVDRSYTAVSVTDPLFKNMPDLQSGVLKEEVEQLRTEERLSQQISEGDAVRLIQKICRKYMRRRNDETGSTLRFRLAALLEMIDKSQDEAILISCMEVAVEAHHNELAMKSLRRCNAVVKYAKENKVNSVLAIKLLARATVLIDLMIAFMDDSSIIMIGTELVTRVSYASGASDAFGKAGVFGVLYSALDSYPDNAILVGALLVCGVRLTSKKAANKKLAGTRGGFQTIVSVYKRHLDNTTIVDRLTRYTCNCIDNLPVCQNFFRDAGGCDVIVDIYTFGPEHLESIEVISRLVMNLTALNNVDNMKALGTRQTIIKYFDGLVTSAVNPKVFKSVAMMICSVFSKPELFLDFLPDCNLPMMLMSILDDGNRSIDMDRQDVVFAALMVTQFFGCMEILQPLFLSSQIPNIIIRYTDKAYAKRIRKAASLINRRLRGEVANSEISDASSIKTR